MKKITRRAALTGGRSRAHNAFIARIASHKTRKSTSITGPTISLRRRSPTSRRRPASRSPTTTTIHPKQAEAKVMAGPTGATTSW